DEQWVGAPSGGVAHHGRHRARHTPAVRQEDRSPVIDELEDVCVDAAFAVLGRAGSEREQGAGRYGHHDGPMVEPDLAAPAHQAMGGDTRHSINADLALRPSLAVWSMDDSTGSCRASQPYQGNDAAGLSFEAN